MIKVASAQIDPTKSWEQQLFQHDRQLIGCAFSPCGKFIFAGANDKQVYRWDLESEKKTALTGHSSWIHALDFHPDQKRLITADYVGQVHCWDYTAESPKPLWSIKDAHTRYIRSISISSDGRWLATAGDDRMVRVWNTTDGKLVHELSGHEHRVYSVAFHPDSKNLVSGDRQGGLKHWDAVAGKEVRDLQVAKVLWTEASLSSGAAGAGVLSLAFDESGTSLAVSGVIDVTDGDRNDGTAAVLLVNWKDGKLVRTLQAKAGGFTERAAFHPKGYVIAACCCQESRSTMRFWKTDNDEPVHTIKAGLLGCRDLALHPDGQRFAVVQWEKVGSAGNDASTEKLEQYDLHRGTIRIYQMTEKPADTAKAAS